jgi:hypothetical protein
LKLDLLSTDFGHVFALAEHIEFEKSGWWEEAIRRTVVYVLFRATMGLAEAGVISEVTKLLGEVGQAPILKELSALLASNVVLARDAVIHLSETARSKSSAEERSSIQLEQDSKAAFEEAVRSNGTDLHVRPEWESFQAELLFPLVRELGARTASLLRGEIAVSATGSERAYIESFPPSDRVDVRQIVSEFLAPESDAVRGLVLGYLTHYMLIASNGPDRDTLARIKKTSDTAEFNILLDTNVIFSLLDLHFNPLNVAAKDFLALVRSSPRDVVIKLWVLPETLAEARAALENALDRAPRGQVTQGMAAAALGHGDVSGLLGRYFERASASPGLSPRNHFEPYILGLEEVLKGIGVTVVDEDTSPLRENTRVRRRVSNWYSFVRNDDPATRAFRSRENIEHDVLLVEFVAKHRKEGSESAAAVRWWLLSIDLMLSGQERRDLGGAKSIPSSVNPAELTQLLRFWIPRGDTLEKALLGAIRLPFSFFSYDSAAEKVSLAIIDRISMFANSENFSQGVIESILENETVKNVFASSKRSEAEIHTRAIEAALAEEVQERDDEIRRLRLEISAAKRTTASQHVADSRRSDIARGKEQSKAALLAKVERADRDRRKAEEALAELRAEKSESATGSVQFAHRAAHAELELARLRRRLATWVVVVAFVLIVGSFVLATSLFSLATKPWTLGLVGLGHVLLLVFGLWMAALKGPWKRLTKAQKALGWAWRALGSFLILGVVASLVGSAVSAESTTTPVPAENESPGK